MKVFDNADLLAVFSDVKRADSPNTCVKTRQLRYCKATLCVGYSEKTGRFSVLLRSYRHITISLVCDDQGSVKLAIFCLYRSMATWQHVRKFCALFQNGRELYRAYFEAAHGGKQEIFFE